MLIHSSFSRGHICLITCLIFFVAAFCQKQKAAQEDIVAKLMPEGVPPRVFKLTQDEQTQAVQRLEVEQRQATGKRAQQIAFLMAALGAEYKSNRDYLIQTLHECRKVKA